MADITSPENGISQGIKNPLTEPISPNTARVGSSEGPGVKKVTGNANPNTRFIDAGNTFFHIHASNDRMPYSVGIVSGSQEAAEQPPDHLQALTESTIPAEPSPQDALPASSGIEPVESLELRVINPFREWLEKNMRGKNLNMRSLTTLMKNKSSDARIDHSTISRLFSEDRSPNIPTVAKLVDFFDRGDNDQAYVQEVYEMVLATAPDEIKANLGKGVLTPVVLTGTPTEQLEGYIKLSGVSNRVLAKRMGIDHSTLSRLTKSEGRLPNLSVYSRIMAGLEMNPAQNMEYLRAVIGKGTNTEETLTIKPEAPVIEDSVSSSEPAQESGVTGPKVSSIAVRKNSEKQEIDNEPIWVNAKDLTPEALRDILEIYSEAFGKPPVREQDFQDINELRNKLLSELFGSPGYAEWGLLDVRRMVNEKGQFLRFKTRPLSNTIPQELQEAKDEYLRDLGINSHSPKASALGKAYVKKLVNAFQTRTDEYLLNNSLAVRNSDAVGKPMTNIVEESEEMAA